MDKHVYSDQDLGSGIIMKRNVRESTIRQRNMSAVERKMQDVEEVESEDEKKQEDEDGDDKAIDDESEEGKTSDDENTESDDDQESDDDDNEDEEEEKSSPTTKQSIVYTDDEGSWTKPDILQLIKDNDSKPDDLLFPAGVVCYIQRDKLFTVFMNSIKMGCKTSKGFSFNVNGGVRKALQRAFAYRNSESDRLGLTRSLHKCFITPPPLELQQYFSGLFDGDGCIHAATSTVALTLVCATGSSIDHPEVMRLLQESYGGTIAYAGKKTPNHKHRWQYVIINKAAQILLQHMKDHSIIKQPQAELAFNFVKDLLLTQRIDPVITSRRKVLKTKLKQLKKEYDTITIDPQRLTLLYMAGLTDAEGCIKIKSKTTVRLSVAQKQCPRILDALVSKLGCGKSDNVEWYVHGKTAINMLLRLDPYLIIKKPQCQLILNNLDLLANGKQRKRKNPELEKQIDNLVLMCKKLKKE